MKPEISYDVIVRKKVPYFTSLFLYISTIFFLVLCIFSFIFLPVKNSSQEMQVAYYILAIPEYAKKVLIVSAVGVVVSLPLYIDARFYRKAILIFLTDKIVITGKRIKEEIPVTEIKRAFCMDSNQESTNEKLTIYLEHQNNKMTRIRLKYFEQSEDFMGKLLDYKNIDFKTYDFDFDPDIDNEE